MDGAGGPAPLAGVSERGAVGLPGSDHTFDRERACSSLFPLYRPDRKSRQTIVESGHRALGKMPGRPLRHDLQLQFRQHAADNKDC